MNLELRRPPKWCLHRVCLWHRIKCFFGFHSPKAPWRFELEKDGDDIVFLHTESACFCGKETTLATRKTVMIDDGLAMDSIFEEPKGDFYYH